MACCARDWLASIRVAAAALRCRGTAGRIAIEDIDHNEIAETPVVQDRSLGHDEFRLMGATSDADHIARNACRLADRQIASELDQHVLALLGHVIVGSRRQIEYDTAVTLVGADMHRHVWLAAGECRDGQEGQQRDEQPGRE